MTQAAKTARRTVIRDWAASYANPIALASGEALTLTGREDVWDGHRWLWAVANDGREGWIPDALISEDGRAREAYSAIELTCQTGETLLTLAETHGWALCRNERGEEGWVPLDCLRVE